MAHPTASTFVVQPPFDSDSPGDCFLQSPEGAKFKASKAILYAASPIFRDMFSIPSRPSDASQPETEVPVIPVEEDAETLQAMLQMLYPIDPPTIKSVSLAGKLVRAFDKYFISMTKLQYYLRSILNLDQSLEKDPLACFAISWKLGLEPEAVKASRYTHDANLSDMAVAEAIVSGSGDLAALVALWDLRYRREESLGAFIYTDLVKPFTTFSCGEHGRRCRESLNERERRDRLKEVLKVPYPTCEDPEHFLGFQLIQRQNRCTKCSEDTMNTLLSLTRVAVEGVLKSYPQTISGFSPVGGKRASG